MPVSASRKCQLAAVLPPPGGQHRHRFTLIALFPDVGQPGPERLAALAHSFDQQTGFHQRFAVVGFVGEGERLGDHRAHREVDGAVDVVAVLPVPVNRLFAGGTNNTRYLVA